MTITQNRNFVCKETEFSLQRAREIESAWYQSVVCIDNHKICCKYEKKSPDDDKNCKVDSLIKRSMPYKINENVNP